MLHSASCSRSRWATAPSTTSRRTKTCIAGTWRLSSPRRSRSAVYECAKASDALDVLVELAPRRERKQCADRAGGVRAAREQEHVGSCPGGGGRPALARRVVNDRQRGGDRAPVEAERAQPPVGRRLERCAEARAVERVVDHHARRTCANRRAERRDVLRAHVGI